MAGNIKTASSNFRDQNSLFYDAETTVNESFLSDDVSNFYIYAPMVASASGYFGEIFFSTT